MNTPSGASASRRTAVRRALISVYDKYGIVDLARALASAGSRSSRPAARPGCWSTPASRSSRSRSTPAARDPRGAGQDASSAASTAASSPVRDNRRPPTRDEGPRHRADRPGRGEPLPLRVDRAVREGAAWARSSRTSTSAARRWCAPPRRTSRRDASSSTRRTTRRGRRRARAGRGGLSATTRFALARKAFAHTAYYDAVISGWSWRSATRTARGRAGRSPFPPTLALPLVKVQDLRYGENPHQTAALYRERGDRRGRRARRAARRQGAVVQQPARPRGRVGGGARLRRPALRRSSSTTTPAAPAVGEDVGGGLRAGARDGDPVSALRRRRRAQPDRRQPALAQGSPGPSSRR